MAKEKKAKTEPTLEELQAKKAKRQRGWVRFCAIILAVALTVGMYGLASSGDPEVVSVYPNTVQVSGGNAKKDEPATQPPAATPADSSSTPSATKPSTSDEGGGILDTLLGLLSGIDLSGLADKLDFSGLGITVAGGIQNVKDSLLTLVDKIEASITQKPTITHDAVEYPFPEGAELGSLEERQAVVDLLNNATKKVADEQIGYSGTRLAMYTEGGNVNIGAQTETVNSILSAAGLSLDKVVGSFFGVEGTAEEPVPKMFSVPKGKTFDEELAAGNIESALANCGVMATSLKAEDIQILEGTDPAAGIYVISIKNVDNPNRMSDCGLTRFTNDYLVQNEVAKQVSDSVALAGADIGLLKLSDLQMKYTDIMCQFMVDGEGRLQGLAFMHNAYGKFTVRTNSVQVIGQATVNTYAEYSEFQY